MNSFEGLSSNILILPFTKVKSGSTRHLENHSLRPFTFLPNTSIRSILMQVL